MKKVIGVVISVVILSIVIWIADPAETLKVMLTANPFWIAGGIGLWALSVIARTLRWRFLLNKIKLPISFLDGIRYYTLGTAFSNLTPAKAGDPLRSLMVKRKYGYRFSKSFSAILMEKFGDAFSLVPLSVIAFFNPGIPKLNFWLVAVTLSFLAASGLGIWILSSKGRTTGLASGILWLFNFSDRMRKKKERIKFKLRVFSKTFKSYRSWKGNIAWSFFIWIIDGSFYWVAFKSIGVDVPIMLTVISVPVIVFIGVISFLPGSIGSSEAASIFIFTSLTSASIPQVTAATFIARILSWWMYMIGAGLFLTKRNIK